MPRKRKPTPTETTVPSASPSTPEPLPAPLPTPTEIKIKAAKGRPMLQWVGKTPLTKVTAFPAQRAEAFIPDPLLANELSGGTVWKDWPRAYCRGGLLFHGDNKEVLAHLIANGFREKVKLVYIDPPFDSAADYVRKVNLRGQKGATKLNGEEYGLGEQLQYTDIWSNDNYLQFMFDRLLLLKELLADDGLVFLHCDWNKSHLLRCVLDEAFGPERCLNEITWKRTSARSDSTTFNHIHDTLFLYSKGDSFSFNQLYTEHESAYLEKYYSYTESDGRRYATIDATQAGLRKGSSGEPWRGFNPASKGNHWKFAPSELDKLDSEGRIYWPGKQGGWPRLKSYLDEAKGKAIQSIWSELAAVNSQAEERVDYPTQKPEELLERVILSTSNPGDLVLDCFIGSGTTAAVAQRLGRRWIGCDINKGAIQTTSKRLQTIISEQIATVKKAKAEQTQSKIVEELPATEPPPAQLQFTHWRVNDYDLQIQHNEAVNLACEHIGVARMRSDGYFDGILNKSLVKIVPFGHALNPTDLEGLKQELDNRPDEDRNITLVCLGMELAAKAWIDDWNRLRTGDNAINKVAVIELRTDPKYGKFIEHKPAIAKIKVTRRQDAVNGGDKVKVEILDFVSPTIIERLQQQAGVLQPKIDDWRAMVDCIMIDPDYDGKVFTVALADVPKRKADLVAGEYTLPILEGERTVAIKIIDMLGEEVLVTKVV